MYSIGNCGLYKILTYLKRFACSCDRLTTPRRIAAQVHEVNHSRKPLPYSLLLLVFRRHIILYDTRMNNVRYIIAYRKTSNKRRRRTLGSSSLRLLMPFVAMFHVHVN